MNKLWQPKWPLFAILLALSFRCIVKMSLEIQLLISFHSIMISDNKLYK